MRSSCIIALFIIISPLILSFSFFKSNSRDYADMVREIRAKVGKKLAQKHHMDPIGVHGGMMGSVYIIGLSFQIHHPLDRDEARALIVDSVEELLAAVNSNEEIRPYLKDYPFTTKNVELSIYSNYADGRQVFDPYIRVASVFTSDCITFSTKVPNQVEYKHRYREPYAEALTKIRGNSSQKEIRKSFENKIRKTVTD
jgi:hypothetical protein